MKKVAYYIGSNNATHELEADKIEGIIASHFDGFTAFQVIGYWRGSKEKTLLIQAITEKTDSELAKIAKELKEKLSQESILMEIVESNSAFIQ
jgi:hypothetical protein